MKMSNIKTYKHQNIWTIFGNILNKCSKVTFDENFIFRNTPPDILNFQFNHTEPVQRTW